MPEHIVPYATGGSSLTPTESAELLAINDNLAVLNRGIKNASIMVPHSEDI